MSEPSTAPLDESAVVMGARIRSLRKARGETLVQLAAASGMSQPFLSLVERGHARLSLASMARIAAEFDIRVGELLALPPAERVTKHGVDVVHADRRAAPEASDRKTWQLAQLPGGLYGIEMVGTERIFSEYAVHGDDEFVYVLGGTLEVSLDESDSSVQVLTAGDSITFAAGAPHGWRAADPTGYRVLVVTAPPPASRA